MADRCPSRAPKTRTPDGWTVEQLAQHPTHRYQLEPAAQCELDAGHGDGTALDDVARRRRNGGLLWWDPPLIVVEGGARG